MRSLQDTASVAGHLQPGEWYLAVRSVEGWTHVNDPDGGLEGWVDARQVSRHDDPAATETAVDTTAAKTTAAPTAAEPAPQVETTAWAATHTVPSSGLQAWKQPDPSGAVIATLAANVELQVVERRSDWARVVASNGWQGWVDSRRLVATTPTASPQHQAPAQVVATPTLSGASLAVAIRAHPVLFAAAVAVIVSSVVPWAGGGGSSNAFDIPAAFLWSLEASSTGFNLGLILLVVGAAAVAIVLLPQMQQYRKIAAWVVIALGALFVVQLFRAFSEFEGSGEALVDLFTDGFGIGPWLVIAAGVTMLVKR